MGTSSIGFESVRSAHTGNAFVQLHRGFTSLVWNLVKFGMFHVGGIDINITDLLPCSNTVGLQLSSRLLVLNISFRLYI